MPVKSGTQVVTPSGNIAVAAYAIVRYAGPVGFNSRYELLFALSVVSPSRSLDHRAGYRLSSAPAALPVPMIEWHGHYTGW